MFQVPWSITKSGPIVVWRGVEILPWKVVLFIDGKGGGWWGMVEGLGSKGFFLAPTFDFCRGFLSPSLRFSTFHFPLPTFPFHHFTKLPLLLSIAVHLLFTPTNNEHHYLAFKSRFYTLSAIFRLNLLPDFAPHWIPSIANTHPLSPCQKKSLSDQIDSNCLLLLARHRLTATPLLPSRPCMQINSAPSGLNIRTSAIAYNHRS